MDALARRIERFIRREDLLHRGEPVVVGLSGGADSVVLASILHDMRFPLLAVHVNFNLRGAASDEDEAFVRAWCRDRSIDLVVRVFATEEESEKRGASVQETARELRYEVFEEAALSWGSRRVALGHHRDDQAETLLLNLFRGAGPEGLAGMPVKRTIRPDSVVEVVRPLLDVRRKDIEEYARERGLVWCEDATNLQSKYRRGALRSDILPVIQEHFGATVVENIARSADLMRDYLDQFLAEELRESFASALRALNGDGAIDLEKLRNLTPVIRRRVFIEAVRRFLPAVEADWQTAHEIEDLMGRQAGRKLEFGGGTIWRERDRLLFVSDAGAASDAQRRLEAGGTVDLPGGRLTAERLPAAPDDLARGSPHEVYLDARVVRFPLIVRPWMPGDRFIPLGMTHAKKLSDFLTDEQVAPHRKKDVRVVESNGHIVWVVPLRIAADARIRDDSAESVRLRFVPYENTPIAGT